MSQSDFIREMPKVELHVHLEGSIRPSTLLALARRNGVTLPADDLDGMREFYRFTSFDHFIQVYFTIMGCLKTVDDFGLIAYEFGADMARQSIRYAEATFVPHVSVANTGLPFEEILADPLEAVADMTRALYRHERAFYEQESIPLQALDFRGIQPNFRVGWGIGLLGTSVSLLLPPKIRQDIRNTLCIDRGDTPAPKSRKVVLTMANGHASLGWCFVQQEN